jgi:hypothetical protein
MNIRVDNLISEGYSKVESFTLEDCRQISFISEHSSDISLYDILSAKATGSDVGVDKFHSLLMARSKFINDSLILNNGESNITLNLDIFKTSLIKGIVPVKERLSIDGLDILMDYPSKLYFEDREDLIIDCIKNIFISNKFINFSDLDKSQKYYIFNRLKGSTIDYLNSFVIKNDNDIILMSSKFNLEPIYINFFNNSAFYLLKTLYTYYDYDSIMEMLFILSKRFNDITFLNSRTPIELDNLIRLYEYENSEKN